MLTQTMGSCVGKAKQEVSANGRYLRPSLTAFCANEPSYCCPRDLREIERNASLGMYKISSHVHLCNHRWERTNDRDAERKETTTG
jgi:hypothetical protein